MGCVSLIGQVALFGAWCMPLEGLCGCVHEQHAGVGVHNAMAPSAKHLQFAGNVRANGQHAPFIQTDAQAGRWAVTLTSLAQGVGASVRWSLLTGHTALQRIVQALA